MFKKLVCLVVVMVLSSAAQALPLPIFIDQFDNNAGGDGGGQAWGGSGWFAKDWVYDNVPWGPAAGTEGDLTYYSNYMWGENQPPPPSIANWAFIQQNTDGLPHYIYIDIGKPVTPNYNYLLTFFTGGRKDNQTYTGVLTAEIWAGDPGAGGVLLASADALNPGPDDVLLNQMTLNSGAGGAGNLFLRFEAHGTGIPGQFQQVLIDTVTLIPEPTTIALLGLGGLSLIRRKRS